MMHIRRILATTLGLSLFAPLGVSALGAQQTVPAPGFVLAQAKGNDKDDESRQKGRRPGRDRGNEGAKEGGNPQQGQTGQERRQGQGENGRDRQRSQGQGKPREDSRSKSAAEEKAKPDQTKTKADIKSKTERKGSSDEKAAQQPKQTEPRRQTEDKAGQQRRQDTSDDDRKRFRRDGRDDRDERGGARTGDRDDDRDRLRKGDRDDDRDDRKRGRRDDRDDDRRRVRRDDGDDRAREWIRQREAKKTTVQELTRARIEVGRPLVIDGGARVLRRDGDRIFIRSRDDDRLRWGRGDRREERLSDGRVRTIIVRPDGSQIITVIGRNGEIIHRVRRDPRGREIILIREVRRPPLAVVNLGPLQLSIPREQYIVDSRRASRRDMWMALSAPPVEPIERVYTLDEVRRFDRIRDKMRRIDINTITFDTDSALISEDQIGELEELAAVIQDLIAQNPGELVLLEGHTDAPGDERHNLALSDRRAEAVAVALTDYYDIPPENLVTQGYGEEHLKIPTEGPERENRRVSARRITPLVSEARN